MVEVNSDERKTGRRSGVYFVGKADNQATAMGLNVVAGVLDKKAAGWFEEHWLLACCVAG